MSFIYDDQDLLQKLYKLAQDAVPSNNNQLKDTALQLIDGLKQTFSPLKASSDPTFTDLVDLHSFSEWAEKNNATFNNQPLSSNIMTDDGAQPQTNKSVLTAFLTDLSKKAAGKDTGYYEAVNNLIEQANKRYLTTIKPYVAPTEKENAPGNTAESNKDGKHPYMVNVKLEDKALPPGDQKGEQGTTGKQLTPEFKSKLGASLGLLDQNTVDFDEIVGEAVDLHKFIGDHINGKLHTYLSPVIQNMRATSSKFHLATAKTPDIPALSASHDEVSIMRNIKSNFMNYTDIELANIARCYHELMNDVDVFFASCKKGFGQLGMNFDEIDNQIRLAKEYSTVFFNVSGRFIEEANRATGGIKAPTQ